MDILKIFYDEIVKEAKTGTIDCFFIYNILFETIINHEGNVEEIKRDDRVIVPVLNISNPVEFNKLLIEYVNIALEFYQDSNYLNEVISTSLTNNINIPREKVILALLWSNATIDDFQNPLDFLRKRIEFIKNYQEIEHFSSYNEDLQGTIKIEIVKDELYNETPSQMIITAINSDNEQYEFPRIKFGVSDNTVYFYAMQRKEEVKNSYGKKINRTLYKVNEGLTDDALKDVSVSFVVALSIALNYFKSVGINKINVESILLSRWNAKREMYNKKKEKGYISEEDYQILVEKQMHIQSNLTEKFLRTFLRVASLYDDINITSIPFDVDSALHLEMSAPLETSNSLINSINQSLDFHNKKKII